MPKFASMPKAWRRISVGFVVAISFLHLARQEMIFSVQSERRAGSANTPGQGLVELGGPVSRKVYKNASIHGSVGDVGENDVLAREGNAAIVTAVQESDVADGVTSGAQSASTAVDRNDIRGRGGERRRPSGGVTAQLDVASKAEAEGGGSEAADGGVTPGMLEASKTETEGGGAGGANPGDGLRATGSNLQRPGQTSSHSDKKRIDRGHMPLEVMHLSRQPRRPRTSHSSATSHAYLTSRVTSRLKNGTVRASLESFPTWSPSSSSPPHRASSATSHPANASWHASATSLSAAHRADAASGVPETVEPGSHWRREREQPGLDRWRKPGTCSCYKMEPALFSPEWAQGMCICHLACFYENHVVQFGGSCADPPDSPSGLHVTPVRCTAKTKRETFGHFYASARNEARGQRFHLEDLSWLRTRKSITWMNGTSALAFLDRSATNVYHLVSKTMPWACLNNAKGSGFLSSVERMLVKRSSPLVKVLQKKDGKEGQHAVMLQALLNGVFTTPEEETKGATHGRPPSHWVTRRAMVSSPKRSLGGNHVLFETQRDWAAATRESPLCLESVLFTGALKGTMYQGGREQARAFKESIRRALDVPRFQRDERNSTMPNLLYVQRTPMGKRGFSRKTEELVQGLLASLGLPLRIVSFGTMSFREQYMAVDWADIVFGLHGANMLNPSLFMRGGAVMVEVFPWHFLWRGYANATMANNGVYMGYMLDRQKGLKTNCTVSECFRDAACLYKFRDQRRLTLTNKDLSVIRVLLSIAKNIALDVTKFNTKYRKGQASTALHLDRSFMKSYIGGNCHDFDRDQQCSWLGFLNEDSGKIELCTFHI